MRKISAETFNLKALMLYQMPTNKNLKIGDALKMLLIDPSFNPRTRGN